MSLSVARRSGWVGWTTVFLLLLFAGVHLLERGPINRRGNFNLIDFSNHWASARLWLTGQNPYDNALLYPAWSQGAGAFTPPLHDHWLTLLPPGALATLAPLAALPPGAATAAYFVLCLACIAAMLASVMALAGLRPGTLPGMLFIAAATASAPVQTLIAVGQLSLFAITLILLALWVAKSGRDVIAGVLLGTAAAIKPQLAGPFFLWFLFFARWRVFGWAAGAALTLTLAGILPMHLRGLPWLADWTASIVASSAPGAPNDPTVTGPFRHQLIDLRAWLFTLSEEHHLVGAAGWTISMLLATAYVALLVRLREEPDRLLPLAALCALTLLPVYHKAYDAALLLPALAWALLAVRDGPHRGVAMALLASLALFLVPFSILPFVMERTAALDELAQTWIWRVAIYPHHAVAAIAVAVCLLVAMTRVAAALPVTGVAADLPPERMPDLAPTRG